MSRLSKRLSAFFVMLVMMICIAGCGNSQENDKEKNTGTKVKTGSEENNKASSDKKNAQEPNSSVTGGGDTLVVYFSRTGEQYTVGVIEEGNTAIVAKMIADQTGADLFEVLPADDHYPMTYSELTDVAKREQSKKARPEYAGEVPDLSKYSTIFIGAPVWWGDWPMIMYTFFEKNADALAGKNLIPFSTHEGSGLSGFDDKLSNACPDSTVLAGLAVRGNDAQNARDDVRESVKKWLSDLQ